MPNDPAYIHEAAKRGVFAYIVDGTPEELQSAIDITLQRFSEYQNLQGAFGRRALIEQAKGILMARHATRPQTRRSRCCAVTRNTTAASSPTSPPRSSRAICLLLPGTEQSEVVSPDDPAQPESPDREEA